MKKIAFFIDHLDIFGGLERVTANIANELVNYSEVYIVSVIKDETDKVLDWYSPQIKTIKIETQYSIHKYYIQNKRKICGIINEYGFDVVILQHLSSAFYGKDIKQKTKTKVLFCDHGFMYIPMYGLKKNLILSRASRGCDNLIVLTEKCKNDYIDKYHINKNKIRVIPNWIEIEEKPSKNYNNSSNRIIAVGRLSQQKRFDLLVEAFSMVNKKHPDWYLDLYGEGEERNRIEELVLFHKLEDSFIIKGKRLDMANLYSEYSFLVMSSEYEGLPMVLLEAKKNGLPLVSFDIDTGPRDIITDGVNGVLVEANNVDELANAMCIMIENPKIRAEMAQNSQLGIERFSKENIIMQWLDMLQIS